MPELAVATSTEFEAFSTVIEGTPTFSPIVSDVEVAFPLVSWRPYRVERRQPTPPAVEATSIVSHSQLADYLNRVFASMSQTGIATAWQMWVIPLSVKPAELIGDFQQWAPAAETASLSPAQAALAAVGRVQKWLSIGQYQVATLAGYAPRSLKNWREGMDPYPATVRRLFDLEALLDSLTRKMGVERARLWLADASRDGVSRRDHLSDDEGVRLVISEASDILFERPTVPSVQELDFEEERTPEVSRRMDLFTGPVRRARRLQ